MKSETKSRANNEPATTTAGPNQILSGEEVDKILDDTNQRKLIGKEAIENLIKAGRSLRIQGQDNRLKLGRVAHLTRNECEPYEKSPQTGLTYNKSVAKMGISRGTMEHYRDMYEIQTELGVSGDTFLLLSGEGVNLADIKTKYKTAFKGFTNVWLQRILDLDISDEKAVETLVAEIKAAMSTAPPEKTTEELEEDLNTQLESRRKATNEAEQDSLSEHILETKKQISERYIERMKALVNVVAPLLGWSKEQIKDRMRAFEDELPSQRIKRYNDAVKLVKKIENAFEVGTEVAA